jgi:signal transduction histidine kinase/ABC-type amino acid transport substrate-binding protein
LAGLLILGIAGAAGAPGAEPPRVLRVGVEEDEPPLSFVDAQGHPTGFTVDLLRQMEAGGALKFEIVPSSWKHLTQEFQAGRIDVMANVGITDARRETMDFSISHGHIHAIAYTRPDRPPISLTSQFSGKTVAMLAGTISYSDALRNRFWGARVKIYASWKQVLLAVKDGDCDFGLVANALSYGPVDEMGLHRGFVDDLVYHFHMAVHRGDRIALEQLNDALAQLKENGEFDRLYAKWIGPIEPRQLRLSDLRHYYLPAGLLLVLIVCLFVVQQRVKNKLAMQAAALKASESLLVATGQIAKVGGWRLDVPTQKLTWTLETYLIHEVDPSAAITLEQAIGFYAPEARPTIQEAVNTAIETGKSYNLELPLVTAKGRQIWVRAYGAADLEAGRTAALYGAFQDITEEKRLKDDVIAQKLLDVESKATLAKEREVSEMKTRFMSMVSHEFRTPMTVVMSSVELLRNHPDQINAAKREELFERMITSLQRMTEMLDDVLTLNRMDAGHAAVRLGAVDLPSFLGRLRDEFKMIDHDAHVFALQCEADLRPIVTDPTLLHHMLSNLIGNAVRYSRPGTKISVRAGVCEPQGLTLEVEDEGIGIPSADLPTIFEPFERGSNVGTIKGTGLGLNIVKRMAELLGGTVSVESVDGTGSRFTLTLPPLEMPPTRS